MKTDDRPRQYRKDTLLTHLGRNPETQHGAVNPPVYHASTILSKNIAEWENRPDPRVHFGVVRYGLSGTPTTFALEELLARIEGGYRAAIVCSGLAAVTAPLQGLLSQGDHILMVDSAYGPARNFCNRVLTRMGVETTYYDPLIGAGIAGLFRPNTRAVFVEAPGSQTFEMQDVPAIAAAAHERGVTVLMDNTWATPLYFQAFAKGVDLSIQAGTKYIGGHSDVMLGTISANASLWPRLKETVTTMGLCVGPDDMYLALRGLRTLGVRLERHRQSALTIADWLRERPEVRRVLHPAMEDDPGHAIWRRDFTGSSGLFSIVLKPIADAAVRAFLDALELFGMGFSWGGYESLVILFDCAGYRTATRWAPGGPALRFHVGLEDPNDLITDLERGFAAMAKAA